jgi:dihydrofolate reductase
VEIILIAAISLDGCITRHGEHGTAWTSAADEEHFRRQLAGFDAHVFGSGTYDAERSRIRGALTTARRRVVMTRSPARYAGEELAGALEFTDEPVEAIADRLRADGHRRLAVLGGNVAYRAFLASRLLDEVVLTLEPRVFGMGTRLAGDAIAIDASLRLTEVTHLDESTLLLRYRMPGSA